MGLRPAAFLIKIEFADGGVVTLGVDHEIYVEPSCGSASVALDDDKLELISRVQAVQDELTEPD